ncbi:MAG: acyltransferase [Candidatus Omnitrophota bacterium]|nr:MAG: acyltransferase [Candidatus Omnitrophota bacterium]
MGIYKKKTCRNRDQLRKTAIVGKSPKIVGPIVLNNVKRGQLVIGDYAILRYSKLFCFGKGKLTIGNYCYLGDFTQIDAAEEVTIGNYCMLSNRIVIQDHTSHPLCPRKRRKQLIGLQKTPTNVYDTVIKKVAIEDDVWIGMDALILKGVTIGRGSIVAARAVVTSDVPSYSIVAGNPARVVKTIKEGLK